MRYMHINFVKKITLGQFLNLKSEKALKCI